MLLWNGSSYIVRINTAVAFLSVRFYYHIHNVASRLFVTPAFSV